MKTKLLVGAALAAVFAASGASAQAVGWYGAVDVGGHFPQDINSSNNVALPQGGHANWKWRADPSFLALGRLGYQFTPHWRVEGEFGYRDGRLKSVSSSSPIGLTSAGGSIVDWTYMANVIYDIAPAAGINPFIGLGAGAQQVVFKTHGVLTGTPAGYSTGETLTANDASTVFAWQAIAGLAFKVSDRTNIDLTYRYLDGDKPHWNTSTNGGTPTVPLGVFKGEYQDHSITIGLRYSFAPPPPPVAEAKEFIVYFPFDSTP